MMAGMAITSLLKTNGLQAMVMACAAFCMPTSMTMVRRSRPVSRMTYDSSTPQPIAPRMSSDIIAPSEANSLTMVSRCCRKKTVTSSTRQGNASRFSTLCSRCASASRRMFSHRPRTMGTAMSTRFCTSKLPTGRWTAVAVPTDCVVRAMMAGTVNSVMTLLSAVSETDRATSPPASIENTLLELPPGLQATSMMPMTNSGLTPDT